MSSEKLEKIKKREIVSGDDKGINKSINPEDIAFVRPNKPMSAKEVVEEMKKQGMRPLTLEEMTALTKKKTEGRIEPKDTDILVEAIKDKEKPKELTE